MNRDDEMLDASIRIRTLVRERDEAREQADSFERKFKAKADALTAALQITETIQQQRDEALAQLATVTAELDTLRAWREASLFVEKEWDAQAIAKSLGARLGRSCRKVIAEAVPALLTERDTLAALLRECDAMLEILVTLPAIVSSNSVKSISAFRSRIAAAVKEQP